MLLLKLVEWAGVFSVMQSLSIYVLYLKDNIKMDVKEQG
jgi:hypothetical protein